MHLRAERLLELLEVFYWKGDAYRKANMIYLRVRESDYQLEVMDAAIDISRDGYTVGVSFGDDIARSAMEIARIIEVDSKRVKHNRS